MVEEKKKKWYVEWFPFFIALLVVLLVKQFVVTPIRVNGPSMNPTLQNGDIMIMDRISYRFQKIERFDIVIFPYRGEDLIKRVIGLPGEAILYKDNVLYINGEKVVEDYTREAMGDFSLADLDLDVIPKDNYLVLGDNRGDSTDSRVFGVIDKNIIKGKTRFTLFPIGRFGGKK